MANFPNPPRLEAVRRHELGSDLHLRHVVGGTAGSAGFRHHSVGSVGKPPNVDLTTELVNMILAQRAFQANAQSITTANQLSETVINITH